MENAIENGLSAGTLLGYPVINVKVPVLDGNWSEKRSTTSVFEMAGATLLRDLIKDSAPTLLEPLMDIEISTPGEQAPLIMNDIISARRGRIIEIKDEIGRFGGEDDKRKILVANIPLTETLGYSTFLRSITKVNELFLKLRNYLFN